MVKKIKIVILIAIAILIIFKIPLYSNAGLDEIIKNAKGFLDITPSEGSSVVTPSETNINGIFDTVSEILLTIAIAVTFISLAVMGINFAIQNAEDKAKIKESMVPWIIGVVISFGAYTIWKATMTIFYKF